MGVKSAALARGPLSLPALKDRASRGGPGDVAADAVDFAEDDDGSFYVEGPARFPLCEACGEQFEIPEFSLLGGPDAT